MDKSRFERAKDALYNAFFNGTLAKEECSMCAVGNIVNQSGELKQYNNEILKDLDDSEFLKFSHFWKVCFYTDTNGTQINDIGKFPKAEEKILALTGYSAKELFLVEKAFENNTKIQSLNYKQHTEQEILNDQYNGLIAVFEVLCKLDNIETENFKAKLSSHPKLELCN